MLVSSRPDGVPRVISTRGSPNIRDTSRKVSRPPGPGGYAGGVGFPGQSSEVPRAGFLRGLKEDSHDAP